MPSTRQLAPHFFALALALLAPGWMPTTSAMAQDQSQRSTAVLNVEGQGIDADVVGTLTEILRREVQQNMYQVVNSTPVNLSDIVVLLGCDASSNECLKGAAEQLDVQVLVYGVVTREQDVYRVRVELFDRAQRKVTHRMQETVPLGGDLIITYRRAVEQFFGQLRKEQLAASVTITSNVRGASVRLNGEDVGTTPFERTGLAPGLYVIEVSKPGFSSWNTEVELGERARMSMRAPLQKERVATPVDTVITPPAANQAGTSVSIPQERDDQVNWGGWSLVTLGGASLAGSGVMALLFKGIERDIDTRNADGTLTRTDYDALVGRGRSYELSHRILLGAGLVSVVGGTAWLLIKSEQKSALLPVQSMEVHASPAGLSGVLRF